MGAIEDKAARFAALHESGCFALPNPWDLGSARLLVALGAPALATSSGAYAFTRGLPDGAQITRDQALAHAAEINAATPLPVTADLEDGYGAAPEAAAETVRLAVAAGLAGCSIEDADLLNPPGVYGFDLAADRIRACVEAARAAGRPFTLTARADGVLTGAYDLGEAIRRLQAFEAAGADVLYAPLPGDLAAQARICASVSKPVNALAAGPLLGQDMDALASAGVRRVSLGSTLARKTHAIVVESAKALFELGDFAPLRGGASARDVDPLLAKGAAAASEKKGGE